MAATRCRLSAPGDRILVEAGPDRAPAML